MDANGRIIPMVEDDQGEGVKDPLTIDDIIRMGREDAKNFHKGDKDPKYRWSTIPHPPIRPLVKGNR